MWLFRELQIRVKFVKLTVLGMVSERSVCTVVVVGTWMGGRVMVPSVASLLGRATVCSRGPMACFRLLDFMRISCRASRGNRQVNRTVTLLLRSRLMIAVDATLPRVSRLCMLPVHLLTSQLVCGVLDRLRFSRLGVTMAKR